jgi:hypothetical protein
VGSRSNHLAYVRMPDDDNRGEPTLFIVEIHGFYMWEAADGLAIEGMGGGNTAPVETCRVARVRVFKNAKFDARVGGKPDAKAVATDRQRWDEAARKEAAARTGNAPDLKSKERNTKRAKKAFTETSAERFTGAQRATLPVMLIDTKQGGRYGFWFVRVADLLGHVAATKCSDDPTVLKCVPCTVEDALEWGMW